MSVWLTGPSSLQDGGGDGAKELEELQSERMKVVQLDVCSDEQVERAVEVIQDGLADSERGEDLGGGVRPPPLDSKQTRVSALQDCGRW